jgi:predicted GNAT family N-acyltransferase
MSAPNYLIDTNVFIHLEDALAVPPELALLLRLAAKHGVGVFVHEAARDDIARDRDAVRRQVSLSKVDKFRLIAKVRGLKSQDLEQQFGKLPRPNDIVDATLLHALAIGVADFLITQDQGLHDRARRHAPELSGCVLYVADAVSLLRSTYEPREVAIPFVEEIDAHAIPLIDPIFDSLREGYPEFDNWWRTKCVKEMRKCWVVTDNGRLGGLIVRKDEAEGYTDASLFGKKILKICTFKVRPERRGVKLGELLLKQVLWFAQTNAYDVAYVTAYPAQETLIDLIIYYGFAHTYTKQSGEHVYEKPLSRAALDMLEGQTPFDAARMAYPRFSTTDAVTGYVIPIKEPFHESLFPELVDKRQSDLFAYSGSTSPKTSGNTIRKVYLCRAQARIDHSGDILLFYKGKAERLPSQAITTVGIFENMTFAKSTEDLRRLAGGRSVYSEEQLHAFKASEGRPVKVINFLLIGHIAPPIGLQDLIQFGVFAGHPPQSILWLRREQLAAVLLRVSNFGFQLLR